MEIIRLICKTNSRGSCKVRMKDRQIGCKKWCNKCNTNTNNKGSSNNRSNKDKHRLKYRPRIGTYKTWIWWGWGIKRMSTEGRFRIMEILQIFHQWAWLQQWRLSTRQEMKAVEVNQWMMAQEVFNRCQESQICLDWHRCRIIMEWTVWISKFFLGLLIHRGYNSLIS